MIVICTSKRTLEGRYFRTALMAVLDMIRTVVSATLIIREDVSELVIASAEQIPST
jgi:hypothetical protein